MMEFLDGNQELRKLPAGSLNTVIDILEIDNHWKKLMCFIPKNPEDLDSDLKYNSEHVQRIKEHADFNKLKGAKVLFEEWGASGRIRPTPRSLMRILVKAELYTAANEIADMLKADIINNESNGQDPAQNMGLGTTAQINSDSDKNENQSVEEQKKVCNDMTPPCQNEYLIPDINMLNPKSSKMYGQRQNSDYTTEYPSKSNYNNDSDNSKVIPDIDADLLKNSDLIQFEYIFLVTITRNFTNCIGRGGFGDVYIGIDPNYGQLAVKKSRNQASADSRVDFNKIFNREVRSLSHLRHENIVPMLGFSLSGPDPCIVCRYIDGGSLIQKLTDQVLSESERINIIVGVSEGLKYIHNTVVPGVTQEMRANVKYYFLHGDVKSANILLTKELVPKLCDFGLAKQYTSTHFTMAIIGTFPYMAPESLNGTVTQKSDIFSFGVVLLEVLTGLKPVVKTSKGEVNIRSYISGTYNGDITNVLDSVANWTKAAEIYNLAKLCLKDDKEMRPSMAEICEMLCGIIKLQPKTVKV